MHPNSHKFLRRSWLLGLLAWSATPGPASAQVDPRSIYFTRGKQLGVTFDDVVALPWPSANPRPTVVAHQAAGLSEPADLAVGPSGKLYVSSLYHFPFGRVLCFGVDGTPDDAVNAELALYAQQCGIQHPCGVLFGPDGRLYVADVGTSTGTVFCYRLAEFFPGNAGWYALATPTPSGLARPGYMVLRPGGAGTGAGNLLVTDYDANAVKEFVLRTSAEFDGGNEGAFVGNFLSTLQPETICYGPDGSLYVARTNAGVVARYSGLGAVGTLLSQFAPTPANAEGLESPHGIGFGPDGMLYVGSHESGDILRYRVPAASSSPGIFDSVFASAAGDPTSIHFVQVPQVGSTFCGGPAIAATCCANAGATSPPGADHGCPNSRYAQGAQLFGTLGQLNPGEVRLSAWGLPATTLALFLQSSVSISPTPFGDGARCIGGHLRRIALKPIQNGASSYPEPGDPDIRTRSQALGDTIPPGGVRHYQVYFRENASPCGAGHTTSITNGTTITWP